MNKQQIQQNAHINQRYFVVLKSRIAYDRNGKKEKELTFFYFHNNKTFIFESISVFFFMWNAHHLHLYIFFLQFFWHIFFSKIIGNQVILVFRNVILIFSSIKKPPTIQEQKTKIRFQLCEFGDPSNENAPYFEYTYSSSMFEKISTDLLVKP